MVIPNGANGSAMPLWMKFVSAVGVPSAIAIYLVWFLGTAVLGAIQGHAEQHAAETRVLTSVLQQLCANTATTAADRVGCFPESR